MILLEASGFNNELAIKFAYEESPESYLQSLESVAAEILKEELFPADLKEEFREGCMECFVDPQKFKFKIGDRALMHAVFRKLIDGSFAKKCVRRKIINKNFQPDQANEDGFDSCFNEGNKAKLTAQILNSWNTENLDFEPPDKFKFSKCSGKSWSVLCEKCNRETKIQVTKKDATINFNPGNFMRHLKIHARLKKPKSGFNKKKSTNEVLIKIPEVKIFDNSSTKLPENEEYDDPPILLEMQQANQRFMEHSTQPPTKFTLDYQPQEEKSPKYAASTSNYQHETSLTQQPTKFSLDYKPHFQFLDGNTLRARRFKGKFCPLKTDRRVGISPNSYWYLIVDDGKLLRVAVNNYFDIKNYDCHITESSLVDLKECKISEDIVKVLMKIQ